MIPKIIHLVWLGKSSNKIKKQIDRITKSCPNFEIKVWTLSNFDVSKFDYTQKALEKGQYAFVSDYIRLWVLYNFGGTYLDLDVNIIQPIDLDFKKNDNFVVGFEKRNFIGSAVISSVKGSSIIKNMLDYMDKLVKTNPETIGTVANVTWMSNILHNEGILLDGKEHITKKGIHVLDMKAYGYPNEKSRVIHIMSASWVSGRPISQKIGSFLRKKITNTSRAVVYEKLRKFIWK